MKIRRRRVLAVGLVLGATALLSLDIEDAKTSGSYGFLSSAHAQPLRKLIARLRGQTLPEGIDKAEGRIEATQVDVSSKYPGQLAEISVGEGTKVTIGQVIGRVSSPEFEAQLRAAQSELQSAQDGLAGAEFRNRLAAKRARIRQVRFGARTGAHEVRLHCEAGIPRAAAQLQVGASSGPEHDRPAGSGAERHQGGGSQSRANRVDDTRSHARVPTERAGSVSDGAKRRDRRGRRTDRDDSSISRTSTWSFSLTRLTPAGLE